MKPACKGADCNGKTYRNLIEDEDDDD